MLNINWLEAFGYLASILVAVSLMMSSVIKLRIINALGALCFSIYGFLIGAFPVGFLNGFILIINIYYLGKMSLNKEYFKLLEVGIQSPYFLYFKMFYRNEIEKYEPEYFKMESKNTSVFLMLRNLNPVGILVGEKVEGTFHVHLDFVIPQYRDFKMGYFLYHLNRSFFIDQGINKIRTQASIPRHISYLRKMGFSNPNINIPHLFEMNL